MTLLEKIQRNDAHVGVIGLGYVGLPLAVEFASVGLAVTGFDIDDGRVAQVRAGTSYISDVPDERLRPLVESGRLGATTDFDQLATMDAVSICVPTPLRKSKDPDISYIVEAAEAVRRRLHRGQLVTLESTTYPGTTEEVVRPILEADGLVIGTDVFLAFSPERVDPGNPRFHTRNTPKIIGGVTPNCGLAAKALYEKAVERVVLVSSTQTAEMVKLLENTFRAVNIGLVNEIAIMCDRLKLDVWEVIDAAATKPFGFHPFYPGPGLGGHCIPIDPHYLSWKLKLLNYNARFIELAGEINAAMPRYVVNRLVHALNTRRKCLNGSRVLVIGVAYKKNVSDVRESPALDILELLREGGAEISYHDPYVPRITHGPFDLASVPLDPAHIEAADAVVVVTDHQSIDWNAVARAASLVLDTRNAVTERRENVFKL
ncbi:MAG: nucleotide sugar dehydrogenase [bacterium]